MHLTRPGQSTCVMWLSSSDSSLFRCPSCSAATLLRRERNVKLMKLLKLIGKPRMVRNLLQTSKQTGRNKQFKSIWPHKQRKSSQNTKSPKELTSTRLLKHLNPNKLLLKTTSWRGRHQTSHRTSCRLTREASTSRRNARFKLICLQNGKACSRTHRISPFNESAYPWNRRQTHSAEARHHHVSLILTR